MDEKPRLGSRGRGELSRRSRVAQNKHVSREMHTRCTRVDYNLPSLLHAWDVQHLLVRNKVNREPSKHSAFELGQASIGKRCSWTSVRAFKNLVFDSRYQHLDRGSFRSDEYSLQHAHD